MPENPLGSIAFVGCVLILNAIGSFIALRRGRTDHSTAFRPRLRRPKGNFGRNVLIWQIDLLAVLFILHDADSWNARSIGLTPSISLWASVAIGIVAYLLLYAIYATILRQTPWYDRVAERTFIVTVALVPRDRRGKLAALVAFCALNPIAEEIMFRGILVHQIGLYSGYAMIGVGLGLTASVLNHLYQGPSLLPFHALFYAVAVILLYSSAGLAGAIAFHFAGDWFPFMRLKSGVREYRMTRRQRKAG